MYADTCTKFVYTVSASELFVVAIVDEERSQVLKFFRHSVSVKFDHELAMGCSCILSIFRDWIVFTTHSSAVQIQNVRKLYL